MPVRDFLISKKNNEHTGIKIIKSYKEILSMSYGELYKKALQVLSHITNLGVSPNDELIILINQKESFIITYWACILGGIKSVPARASVEYLNNTIKLSKAVSNRFLITEQDFYDTFKKICRENNIDKLITYPAENVLITLKVQEELIQITDEKQVVTILFSSGSISDPKGVALTDEIVCKYMRCVERTIELDESDKFLGWLPLNHNTALILFHMFPLYLGAQQDHIMETQVISNCKILLDMATKLQTTITGTIPTQLDYYINYANKNPQFKDWDFNHLHTFLVGAEPVTTNKCDEFSEALGRFGFKENIIVPAYGLTETTSMIALHKKGDAIKSINIDSNQLSIGSSVKYFDKLEPNARNFTSVGTAIEGVQLQISHENGKGLGDDVIGIVQIKSPTIIKTYYGTNESVISNEGWLDTGDIGLIHRGELYIIGRYKDMFIINGKNYYCNDLEVDLAENIKLNINTFAIASIDKGELEEESLICFLLKGGQSEQELHAISHAIYNYCFNKHGIVISCFIRLEDFEITAAGKVKRHYMKKCFLSKKEGFTDVYKYNNSKQNSSNLEDILGNIKKIFSEIVLVNLDINDNILDYITDSISIAKIHLMIDQAYPEAVEIHELFMYPSIFEISNCVYEAVHKVG